MTEVSKLFSAVSKGLEELMADNGFKAVFPAGVKANELPMFSENGKERIVYEGKKGIVKIEHSEKLINVMFANTLPEEVEDSDFKTLSSTYFDSETADETDLKYITNEAVDTLTGVFGTKQAVVKKKLPPPVSKTAAKSGTMAYDPNSLANRLCGAYPELKPYYRANIETYDRFLAEEFFDKYGTKVIIDTIRQNDKLKMKKLFNILNSVFDDGTNETQSLICVTILGKMDNDPQLIENAKAYMEDYLADPVIAVNKYLSSAAGKKAKKKLANPPLYKPKKKKKSMMSTLTGGMPQ